MINADAKPRCFRLIFVSQWLDAELIYQRISSPDQPMGGIWSSGSGASAPLVKWVGADEKQNASFSDDLKLTIALNPKATQYMKQSCAAVWTVELEVDVAHLQALHRLHEQMVSLPCTYTKLIVPSAAFQNVARQYLDDELANIGALHLKCQAEDMILANVSIVIDIVSSHDRLNRRIYGVRSNSIQEIDGNGVSWMFSEGPYIVGNQGDIMLGTLLWRNDRLLRCWMHYELPNFVGDSYEVDKLSGRQ